MAEELQHLIDKIQSEAVDEAKKQAEDIISRARQKAADLVKTAEKEAAQRLEKADTDAQAYSVRSTKTLEQAARDLLITVGQGVDNILSDLIVDSVEEAMSTEVMGQMLVAIAQAYADQPGESRVEYLVGSDDKAKLVKFLAAKYREEMISGIEIHTDNEIIKGFKVSFVEDHVYHDFTSEAIAEALHHFLRADLAEIVHRVAAEGADNGKKSKKKKSSK